MNKAGSAGTIARCSAASTALATALMLILSLAGQEPSQAQASGSTSSSANQVVNTANDYRSVIGLHPWSIPRRHIVLGYSPNGAYALTSGKREVYLWDAKRGQVLGALSGDMLAQESRTRRFQFSLDSRRLLLQMGEQWRLWDIASLRPILTDVFAPLRSGYASFVKDDEEVAHLGFRDGEDDLEGEEQYLTLIDLEKGEIDRKDQVEVPDGPISMLRESGEAVIYSSQPEYRWDSDSRGDYKEFGFTVIDLRRGRTYSEDMVKARAEDYTGVDGGPDMILSYDGKHALIQRPDTQTGVRAYLFDLTKREIVRAIDLSPVREQLQESNAWNDELTWVFPSADSYFALSDEFTITFNSVTGEAMKLVTLPEDRVNVRFERRFEQTRHLAWNPQSGLYAEVVPVIAGAMNPNITTSDAAPHEMSFFSPDGSFKSWADVVPGAKASTLSLPESYDWVRLSADGKYVVCWSSTKASEYVIRALDGSSMVLRAKPWRERDTWMDELRVTCPIGIDHHRGVLLVSPGEHTRKLGTSPVALELKSGRAAPAIYIPPERGQVDPLAWLPGAQQGVIDRDGLLVLWDYQKGEAIREFTEVWSARQTYVSRDGKRIVLVYAPIGESTKVVTVAVDNGKILNELEVDAKLDAGLAVDHSGDVLLASVKEGGKVATVDLSSGKIAFTLDLPESLEAPSAASLAKGNRFAVAQGNDRVLVLDAESGEYVRRIDFDPNPTAEMSPGISVSHLEFAPAAGSAMVLTRRGRFLVYDLLDR